MDMTVYNDGIPGKRHAHAGETHNPPTLAPVVCPESR